MKIFYIHGFNSGKSSSTVKTLSTILNDEYSFQCLEYDSSKSFDYNLIDLKVQLYDALSEDEEFILIGSSLGGFYTERFGFELKDETLNHLGNILINPCNNPKEQLRQFLGKTTSFETGKEWILTEELLNTYNYIDTRSYTIDRIVILGMDDDVIDPEINNGYWINKSLIYKWHGVGHRINNASLIIIFKHIDVKSIINSFWS